MLSFAVAYRMAVWIGLNRYADRPFSWCEWGLIVLPLRLRHNMAEYNSYIRGNFRAARDGRERRNIALFALDDEKIIIEKR